MASRRRHRRPRHPDHGAHVEPRYTQAKDGRPATISGYRVVNQVRLTVREVKRLGEVSTAPSRSEPTRSTASASTSANAETLKDEARKQAIANARRRAELYAMAAGVQLGRCSLFPRT